MCLQKKYDDVDVAVVAHNQNAQRCVNSISLSCVASYTNLVTTHTPVRPIVIPIAHLQLPPVAVENHWTLTPGTRAQLHYHLLYSSNAHSYTHRQSFALTLLAHVCECECVRVCVR